MLNRLSTPVDPTTLASHLMSVAQGSRGSAPDDVPWALAATALVDPSIQERLAPLLLRRMRDLIDVDAANAGPGPGPGSAYDRRMAWRYWALGRAAVGMTGTIGDEAAHLADHFVGCRPVDPLAIAMMAAGADSLLLHQPSSLESMTVLRRSAPLLHRPRPTPDWCWPEPELNPIDALLPLALVAAGDRLGEGALVRSGLVLLDWRLGQNGRSGDAVHELAMSIDACARAGALTGDGKWERRAHALAAAVPVEVTLRTSDLCAWHLAARQLDEFCCAPVGVTTATGLVTTRR
jgi:hypothetical protein